MTSLQTMNVPEDEVQQVHDRLVAKREEMNESYRPMLMKRFINEQGLSPEEAELAVNELLDSPEMDKAFDNEGVMGGSVNEADIYNELKVLWAPPRILNEEPVILQRIMNPSRLSLTRPLGTQLKAARKAIVVRIMGLSEFGAHP